MNYAFKRAGSIEKDDEEIDLPEDLLQLLSESSPKEQSKRREMQMMDKAVIIVKKYMDYAKLKKSNV